MTTRKTDPLLLAGKVIAIFMQGIMAVAGIALLFAMPVMLFFRADIVTQYAEASGDPDVVFPVFTALGVIAICFGIVAAMFVFFGRLRRIIDTVGDGDPFDPVNADRLSLMGWLMLAVQLLLLPASALGAHLAQYADEIEGMNVTIGGGLDLSAILLIVILFILARVFRHGAAMRADLEGTV